MRLYVRNVETISGTRCLVIMLSRAHFELFSCASYMTPCHAAWGTVPRFHIMLTLYIRFTSVLFVSQQPKEEYVVSTSTDKPARNTFTHCLISDSVEGCSSISSDVNVRVPHTLIHYTYNSSMNDGSYTSAPGHQMTILQLNLSGKLFPYHM